MKLVRLLHIIGLNAGFYGSMLTLTGVSIVFVWLPYFVWLRHAKGFERGEAARRMLWTYGRVWTKLLMTFTAVTVRVEGKGLPTPCIITPNHQSFFDAYCIGFLRVPNVLFAVRAWPFRIPGYGPYMRLAGYLNTEAMDSEEMLRQARKMLDQGASIVVFPEGTRSPDGRLQRFRAGAFHLAAATQRPIVPLCIDGTGNFLKKGQIILRPAVITITLLEPVSPEQFAASGDEVPLLLRRLTKARLEEALSGPANATL